MLKLLPFLLLVSSSIIGQGNYNSKSMVVSNSDLQNNTFSQDTTANAFFIYEKGYSRIQNGGDYNLLTDYAAKIKILNEKGYDNATVEIVLYKDKSNKQTYQDLVAHTYNLEDGKIVKTKVTETSIYKEEYDKHFTRIKFTFPNLKPGSVLTYSYQFASPFKYRFKGWKFQSDIPKIHSQFTADIPGNYLYNIRLIGYQKLSKDESSIKKNCLSVNYMESTADCSHNEYAMENIPAFINEKYMTSENNYLSRIAFELSEFRWFDGSVKKYTKTWKSVDREFKTEKSIGRQLKKLSVTQNILPDSLAKTANTLKKAKDIYNYLCSTYKWNQKFNIFRGVEIKDIIKNKTGNVGEINILLHNTLKQQGFDVKPIMLSTRNNGFPTKIHPVLNDFNYLIVHLNLDDKIYLLDATESTLDFGEIPFRCLNKYGRLLDFKNGSSWIDIEPSKNTSNYYREFLKLDQDLNISGQSSYNFSGYHAYYKRKKYKDFSQNKTIEALKDDYENYNLSNIEIEGTKTNDKPFKLNFDFSYTPDQADGIIFINPFLSPFFEENPLKLNQRTYPVDFGYKDSYSYMVLIEIPDGYEFEEIPKNIIYNLPDNLGKVIVSAEVKGKMLTLNQRINFTSSYYTVPYYTSLKEFFNHIVDINTNTLITVKKSL